GVPFFMNVHRWLKKPAGTGNGVNLWTPTGDFGDAAACHLLAGSGYDILFLSAGDAAQEDWLAQPQLLAMFSIRDGVLDMADVHRYLGWPVARFTAAIRAALARPAPP
ncbi:MAG TPA: hypothetical protein VKY74_11525, partial [Chloroflexia bacterium]|nr:hypothetical protein [Chloroflexia bacterium]